MLSRLAIFLQVALAFTPVVHTSLTSGHDDCLATLTGAPTVRLDRATVIGTTDEDVTSFHGIPFAQPPVGDLRLRLPRPVESYKGIINATQTAAQCIQLAASIRIDMPQEMLQDVIAAVPDFDLPLPQSEDCLTLDVQVPVGTKSGDNLPVIAFIYGGGFTTGSTSQMPGDTIITRSVELGKPVIYVAMNYRLHALGFLGGNEVRNAGIGNLGLHDQREALRWIQKHISAFGGDPNKVTLWGPSAGAISTALQMVTNGGNSEGLFHGAVMSAGSPLPTGDISRFQPYYDTIVSNAGCANATDTLDCLRHVPLDTLMDAVSPLPNVLGYQGLNFPWAPHADGVFLTAPPQHLVLEGSVANIPVITGDALDEGTLFATGSWNVTTEDEFWSYVSEFWFPRTPQDQLAPIFDLYPNDPAQGSPFGTGDANQLAPMYKRMAAFQGDAIFQAPRRWFIEERFDKQYMWSYISERGPSEGLGCDHGSDLGGALFLGNELSDYIIQFAWTGNPNGASNRTIAWPTYNKTGRKILTILDGDVPLAIGVDSMRLDAMASLSSLTLAYPL